MNRVEHIRLESALLSFFLSVLITDGNLYKMCRPAPSEYFLKRDLEGLLKKITLMTSQPCL
jgi:hypothetical protein